MKAVDFWPNNIASIVANAGNSYHPTEATQQEQRIKKKQQNLT